VNAGPGTGQHFGAYRLEAQIGRGGMGIVYRAVHEHLGRTVALKLLTPELAAAEGFRGRFMRESRLAASLDHPSVVTVYDAGDVNGTLYIAMRFIDGTDLAGLLASAGILAPDRAIALLGQVAAGLDAAHAAGLVHRDVKPANVLIEGQRAYLTDFGLTKPVASATAITTAGQFLGTVAYVAPEQIAGRDVDGRADVYALGCVLFECLTSTRPFIRDNDVAVLYAHLSEAPPRPTEVRAGLPAALDPVVTRALAKEPAERYGTCSELIDAARAALAERPQATAALPPQPSLPTEALPARLSTARSAQAQPQSLATSALPPSLSRLPPPPTPPAPGRPRRRRGLLIGAVVAAIAAAGAAAAVVALTSGDDESAPAAASRDRSSPPPARDSSTIPVGDRPQSVTVAAGRLWVANSGDGTVTRVAPDGSDRSVIEVGAEPTGIASNGEEVWVVNSGDATVERIDASSGQKIGAPLATGPSPAHVAVNSRRAFVTNAGDGTISEWYVPSGKPRRAPFPAGERPQGIVVVPPDNWTANAGEDVVTRLSHGVTLDRIAVGDEPVGIAASEGAVWVTGSGDDTVSRIEIANPGGGAKAIPVGDEPTAVAVGEGFVWVANSGDQSVTRLDPAGGKPVGEPIAVPGRPAGVTVGAGAAWVTLPERDAVMRLEP
jgi:serine/threonine protein kinase